MCGLVGVINNSYSYKLDFDKWFKQALICDSVRGDHSTGICTVTSGYEVNTFKKAGDPFVLLGDKDVNIALSKSNKVLMGHNRYATKGSISDDTAHPFTHGDITLCHNGTLYAHRTLSHRADFDVDSEAVCYMLSISKDTIKDLEKLDGAYALTWYDSLFKTFHIARNKERKLYLARVLDQQGFGAYLYASEVGMLMWLANRIGIKIAEPKLVPEGQLLTFKLDSKRVEEFTTTPFTPKESYEDSWRGGRSVTYINGASKVYNSSNSSSTNLTKTYKVEPIDDPHKLIDRVVDVCFMQWTPYDNSPNGYGKCEGLYDNDIEVVLGAIKHTEYRAILGAPTTKIKITGRAKEGHYFGILHKEDSVKLVTSFTDTKESVKSPIDNSQVDIESSWEEAWAQLAEANAESSKKKEEDYCENCNDPLDNSKTFKAWNGKLFCIDCKEMHPEAIF